MTEEDKIAKEFVTHIANKLKTDLMYSIRKSDNPYEKGQSDIDLIIVPVKDELSAQFYMWMLVEGILKYGVVQHQNKKTGKITTEGLIDVMIFFNKEAVNNCRIAMIEVGNFKVIKYKSDKK